MKIIIPKTNYPSGEKYYTNYVKEDICYNTDETGFNELLIRTDGIVYGITLPHIETFESKLLSLIEKDESEVKQNTVTEDFVLKLVATVQRDTSKHLFLSWIDET